LPQARPESQPIAAPPVLKPAWQELEPVVHAAPVLPPARPEPKPVAEPTSDIPWWLTEAPAHATALEQFVKAHAPHIRVGSWQTELAGEGDEETATAVAAEEKAHATPSRLNGLRGLFSALGLKEVGHLAPMASEAAPVPAPQQERTVSVQTAPAPAAPVPAPPEPAVPARTIAPIPEPKPAFAAAAGNSSREYSTRRVTAEPEFLPPKLEEPTRRDSRDAFDDVQILPSRRGQYKRKS
jgi:hypothetical protein